MKRRLFQGLLIVALLCGAVLLAHPTAAWAEVTATKPTQGDGSVGNPYQIGSAEELYWFAALVNDTENPDLDACAVLTADITINSNVLNADGSLNGDAATTFDQWTPIGTYDGNRYTGNFDGNNKTIKGLYINSSEKYVGLFGCIGTNGTVKNLTLADSYIRISGSTANVGGICGINQGSIKNCSNSGAVTGSGGTYTYYVGGICGANDGGIITSCSNSGDVSGSGEVGGICGQNANGGITSCSNSGTVSGSGFGTYVGGICGYNWGSITTCRNSGNDCNVTGSGTGTYVGGICGYNGISITNCSNSGAVTGTANVGGICGKNEGGIMNCSNSGTVSGSGNYVGGICGQNTGSITNCSNSGTVTGSGTGTYVGGICGYNLYSITNCSNSGTVSGSGTNVGGICGQNTGSITNCSNSGAVSGSTAGGICGWNEGSITTCSNSGAVSGSGTNVGGICGYNNDRGYFVVGSITNCYWRIDTANKGVGGGYGTVTDVAGKTAEQFASGEVAWLLNGSSTSGPWRQNLSGNDKDAFPTLDLTHEIVVRLIYTDEQNSTQTIYDNAAGKTPSIVLPEGRSYVWYCNEELTGDPVTVIPANVNSNATYWGKLTANTYTVTLNTNNGTIADGKDVTSYTYGTETTLPTAQDITRTGYTFAGWYDNAEFSGGPVTVIPADATGDQTYWAKWTAKSYPSTPPTVSEETSDAIDDAQPGETVTVDLSSGDTTLDKEVFETLAGKDVTLVVELGDGVSWTVKGTDVPADADFTDIDMGVTMGSDGIPVDIINAITGERSSVQITLAHDGAFGFTMTLTAPLGAENAGLWANLYHFNEDANAMTFETAAEIDSDGSVALSLSHASQYAIVIDDHNHGVIELPFTDVSEGDWFYDPVCFVYSQGLMTGTSATTFEPNTSLSRAMLVAVLHRLEGSPQASAGDFTDVADGDWYAQAVNWAASVGVVNGFDDGSFQPNAAITREQMAAILRNYAAYKGLDVSASDDLTTYTDANSVSDWAKESVEWAVGQGLLSGMTIDTLQPQGLSTRAQVAAVLQRYLAN